LWLLRLLRLLPLRLLRLLRLLGLLRLLLLLLRLLLLQLPCVVLIPGVRVPSMMPPRVGRRRWLLHDGRLTGYVQLRGALRIWYVEVEQSGERAAVERH
jgi:hypothetical protein